MLYFLNLNNRNYTIVFHYHLSAFKKFCIISSHFFMEVKFTLQKIILMWTIQWHLVHSQKGLIESFSCSVMSDSCDSMDCSPAGSSVHGIFLARILEWVFIPFSRGSSWCKDWPRISWGFCIAGGFFTAEPLCLSSTLNHKNREKWCWLLFPCLETFSLIALTSRTSNNYHRGKEREILWRKGAGREHKFFMKESIRL